MERMEMDSVRGQEIRERRKLVRDGLKFEHFTSPIGDTGDYSHCDRITTSSKRGHTIVAEVWDGDDDSSCNEMAFFAHAPEDVDYLCSALEQAQQQVAELQDLEAKESEFMHKNGVLYNCTFVDGWQKVLNERDELREQVAQLAAERDEARLHYGQLQNMAETNGMELLPVKGGGLLLRNKRAISAVQQVTQLRAALNELIEAEHGETYDVQRISKAWDAARSLRGKETSK